MVLISLFLLLVSGIIFWHATLAGRLPVSMHTFSLCSLKEQCQELYCVLSFDRGVFQVPGCRCCGQSRPETAATGSEWRGLWVQDSTPFEHTLVFLLFIPLALNADT